MQITSIFKVKILNKSTIIIIFLYISRNENNFLILCCGWNSIRSSGMLFCLRTLMLNPHKTSISMLGDYLE